MDARIVRNENPDTVYVNLRDWSGVPAGVDFVNDAITEGLQFLDRNPDESFFYRMTGDTLVMLHREDMESYHHEVHITVSTIRQSANVRLPR